MSKIQFTTAAAAIILFAFSAYAQTAKNESVYTSLDAKDCKTLESSTEEAGWYRGECKGVAGYKLQVTEGDIRQSINVVAPNKKQYELEFGKVDGGFSFVGAKAEWRVTQTGKKLAPFALIVRFSASKPEDSSKNTSYLIVSKITKTEICITDVVKPGINANEEARTLSDAAASKSCKAFENF